MKEIVNISFPGLGIDEFSLNKIAFTLFGKLEVRWYGILITLGILLAVLYTAWRGKRNESILSDDVLDIALATVVLGVIGARLYYVLTDSGNTYESFLDVIAIWEGGLGIYGGIIGGCLGIVLACAVKKISWRKLFDMAAPGVMLAQAVGRW
ncbi:MAG: prolipoprotein diacylglyceryl transferase, partial [Clostridia bacterium]|nr:prolipoprotein diacylglyceryl transferase [Clostridia bacterium]